MHAGTCSFKSTEEAQIKLLQAEPEATLYEMYVLSKIMWYPNASQLDDAQHKPIIIQ